MEESRMRIESWLADKVPGAAFDDAGTASVQRDADTVVVLELSPSADICHFCALVAPLSEDMPEASLFAALELNRFGKPLGGCWLAWEPDLQMLTLNWNLCARQFHRGDRYRTGGIAAARKRQRHTAAAGRNGLGAGHAPDRQTDGDGAPQCA